MSALTLEHDRRAYLAHVVDHQTYYGQFATDQVVEIVRSWIGDERIKASQDKWFNDIALSRWDHVGRLLPTEVVRAIDLSNSSTMKDSARAHSLSDLVCVVKAAARKIRGW